MGASAVRGKKGIVDTTRLLRNSPFGEWVNVFYDPSKTDETTILAMIKKNDCPKARRTDSRNGVVQNPYLAPGDPIQMKIELTANAKLVGTSGLPEGWEVVGDGKFGKGTSLLTIQTPKSAKQGPASIKLEFDNGSKIEAKVDVVKQVGKH